LESTIHIGSYTQKISGTSGIKTRVYPFLLIPVVFILVFTKVEAQQWHQSSLHMFNKYRDFGSYAGLERKLSIVGQHRTQWYQFGNAPTFSYIGGNLPVYTWKGAIGMDIQNQSEGLINLNRIRVSYNFVTGTNLGLLSVGARLGLYHLNINGGSIRTPEGEYDDGDINHNDPFLLSSQMSGFAPGLEISAYLFSQKYELGVSIAEVPGFYRAIERNNYQFRRNLTSIIQYNIELRNKVKLMPSLIIRTDLIEWQTEMSVVAHFDKDYYAGLLIRGYNLKSFDASGIIFGYRINDRYTLFYSYDIGLSQIRSANEGSHDIILKMNLESLIGAGLPPPKIYNPRFL
jgi:type IX secretion system PorP/SprF family membrane protein